MSKAIDGQKGQPLKSIQRDRYTPDGGKAGQVTHDPKQIDAVVKRAWRAVHHGNVQDVEQTVESFLDKYNRYVHKGEQQEVPE